MSGVFQNIDTPHPLTARLVCTPRLWCGRRTHSLGEKGLGGSIVRTTPDTALHSINVSTLLFVYKVSWSGNPRTGNSRGYCTPQGKCVSTPAECYTCAEHCKYRYCSAKNKTFWKKTIDHMKPKVLTPQKKLGLLLLFTLFKKTINS